MLGNTMKNDWYSRAMSRQIYAYIGSVAGARRPRGVLFAIDTRPAAKTGRRPACAIRKRS